MRIDLTTKEVTKILRDRFASGDASFRVFYEESDKEWEGRTGKMMIEQEKKPDKHNYVLYFTD